MITEYDFATGQLTQRELTAEEVAEREAWNTPENQLEMLRETRNSLLSETDWWATSDRTMTAEQTAYRQALRDLPANTTDPANPVWPTKP